MENASAMNRNEVVRMLDAARRFVTEGNPMLALQAVVTVLRMTGGEESVMPAFQRAQAQYQNDAKTSAAANELSALFAECAIAEASERLSGVADAPADSMMEDEQAPEQQLPQASVPILAESGRMQVVMDASSDGSSFVCRQCGGLVSNLRRDEHLAYWCSPQS